MSYILISSKRLFIQVVQYYYTSKHNNLYLWTNGVFNKKKVSFGQLKSVHKRTEMYWDAILYIDIL